MAVHTGHMMVREATARANQRVKSNETLVALLRSWREDDSEPVAGQQEALLELLHSLDEDSSHFKSLAATVPEEALGLHQ